MRARSWIRRLVGALVITALLDVVFRLVGFGPHLVPLLLVVLAGSALAWLAYDAIEPAPPGWRTPQRDFTRPPGQDSRTAAYLHLVEDNLTARDPRPQLRDRLRFLAELRLRQRHGLALDDPRARSLLGADVLDLLSGSPRRIGIPEIDRTLTRIEEL